MVGNFPEHTAKETWSASVLRWLTFVGPPDTLLSDDGSKWKGDFELDLNTSDGRSIALKVSSKLERSALSSQDLDHLLHWVAAAKKRFSHREMHSTTMFGQSMRARSIELD